MPSVNAIVQARMGSSRLHGKSMAPLAGKPLLFHVLERAAAIDGAGRTILATSEEGANAPLIELAKEMGIDTFAGSEHNVLERYCMASKEFPSDYVVRVTGDNPFTDIFFAGKAVQNAVESGADLWSYNNLPLGTAVEVIKSKALFKALQEASGPHQLEHVTPYIKENPERFTVVRKSAEYKNPFSSLRLTVDTKEDLELAETLYNILYKGKPFGIDEIIACLNERPELVDINSMVEQRPMTSSEIKSEDTSAH
ncbi:MAG: glycosyltransferase family protein [Leptospirales bacterium]|nr:glycosyltransferase family protein [Leptospirales bacterium]